MSEFQRKYSGETSSSDLINRLIALFKRAGLNVLDFEVGENKVTIAFPTESEAKTALGYFTSPKWTWTDMQSNGEHWFVSAEIID